MNFNKPINYDKLSLCCASFCFAIFALLGANTISAIVSNCIFVLFSVVALLLCISKKLRDKCVVVFIICLFASLGSSYAIFSKNIYYIPSEKILFEYEGLECVLEAEIRELSSQGNSYSLYNADLLRIDGKETDTHFGIKPQIRISSFGEDFLEEGDIVSFRAVIEKPETTLDDGFEYRKYLESKAVFLCCTLKGDFTVITPGEPDAISKIHEKLKVGFMKYIGNGYGSYESYISTCMLFGDKSGIDDYLNDIFRMSGLSHILCVSGLHLSILFGVIMWMFGLSQNKRKRRRFILSELFACTIALTYMFFSGFSPSIMRAGFMLISTNIINAVAYYYRKLKSEKAPDRFENFTSVSSLLCSLLIICVISPYSVYDIGFQLSFMSTLGIILVMEIYSPIKYRLKPRFLNYIISPIIVTMSAISFTFPIMAYNFGIFSTTSVFSNLATAFIATPYLALLLFLAIFILLPVNNLTHIICVCLADVCRLLASAVLEIAEYFSSFEFSIIEMSFDLSIFIVFFSCVMLAIVSSIFKFQNAIKIFCSVILALLVFSFSIGFTTTVVGFHTPVLRACTLSKLPYAQISVEDTRILFDFGKGLSKISQNEKLLGKSYYETEKIYVVAPRASTEFENIYYNILFFERYCDIDTLILPSLQAIRNCNINEEKYRELVVKLQSDNYKLNFYNNKIVAGNTEIALHLSKDSTEIYSGTFALICSDNYSEDLAVKASEYADTTLYFCDKAKNSEKGARKQKTKLYVSSHCAKYVEDAEKIFTQDIMEIR